MDWDCNWKLISFLKRHSNCEEGSKYLRLVDDELRFIGPGLRTKHRVGLAFVLDYYKHGSGAWSLCGEGMQCRFDTSRYAGVLIWPHTPSELVAEDFESRAKDARAFLEVYNQWANGEVYGFVLEDLDGEAVESCGGFYDAEAIVETLGHRLKPGDQVRLEGSAKHLISQKHMPVDVVLVDEFDMTAEHAESAAWAARN